MFALSGLRAALAGVGQTPPLFGFVALTPAQPWAEPIRCVAGQGYGVTMVAWHLWCSVGTNMVWEGKTVPKGCVAPSAEPWGWHQREAEG